MVLTIGVAIVYGLELILKTFRAYVIDYAGKKVDLDVSEKVFNQGVGIRMEARPQHTGTFISQLREHESLRDFVTSAAIFTLADFPFLIIYLLVMWLIGGKLVLIPLVAIPALITIAAIMQWPMMKLSQAHVKESNARSGMLIESMEGAETLKTLSAEWRMRRRWRELTDLVSATPVLTATSANGYQRYSPAFTCDLAESISESAFNTSGCVFIAELMAVISISGSFGSATANPLASKKYTDVKKHANSAQHLLCVSECLVCFSLSKLISNLNHLVF